MADQSRRVWVSHGQATPFVSYLDGLRVHRVPKPHSYQPIFEFAPGRLWSIGDVEGQGGDAKTLKTAALANGSLASPWKAVGRIGTHHPDLERITPNFLSYVTGSGMARVNVENGRSVIWASAKAYGFETFQDSLLVSSNRLFVSGPSGLLEFKIQPSSPPSLRVKDKQPFPGSEPLRRLSGLTKSDRGTVVAIAETAHRAIVVEWDGVAWHERYRAKDAADLMTWSTPTALWIHDSSKGLLRARNGRIEPVRPDRTVLGEVNGVAQADNGVFWLATSNGLARRARMLWQPMPRSATRNSKCHSIVGDSQGRLWFACIDRLICLDDGEWSVHRLPRGSMRYYDIGNRPSPSASEDALTALTALTNLQVNSWATAPSWILGLGRAQVNGKDRGRTRNRSRRAGG